MYLGALFREGAGHFLCIYSRIKPSLANKKCEKGIILFVSQSFCLNFAL